MPPCRFGRVVLGGTDGVQVVPLHTAKSESARSTSGTWWSSGLRQLGVLGSHRTVRRQNPRSQCLLVQLDLLGHEQVARPKLSKCPSSRASLRSEILRGVEAGPSHGSAQDLMPGKTSRFSLSGCAIRSWSLSTRGVRRDHDSWRRFVRGMGAR